METAQSNQNSQLQAILTSIEGKTTAELSSPSALHDYLIQLTNWLAFTGEQKARAQRAYNIAKKQAYFNLEANFRSTGHELKPMLAKDFVGAQCHDQAYDFDLADRCYSTIVHTIDAMRSVLSSLKAEMQTLHYAGQ